MIVRYKNANAACQLSNNFLPRLNLLVRRIRAWCDIVSLSPANKIFRPTSQCIPTYEYIFIWVTCDKHVYRCERKFRMLIKKFCLNLKFVTNRYDTWQSFFISFRQLSLVVTVWEIDVLEHRLSDILRRLKKIVHYDKRSKTFENVYERISNFGC